MSKSATSGGLVVVVAFLLIVAAGLFFLGLGVAWGYLVYWFALNVLSVPSPWAEVLGVLAFLLAGIGGNSARSS